MWSGTAREAPDAFDRGVHPTFTAIRLPVRSPEVTRKLMDERLHNLWSGDLQEVRISASFL